MNTPINHSDSIKFEYKLDYLFTIRGVLRYPEQKINWNLITANKWVNMLDICRLI